MTLSEYSMENLSMDDFIGKSHSETDPKSDVKDAAAGTVVCVFVVGDVSIIGKLTTYEVSLSVCFPVECHPLTWTTNIDDWLD